MALRKDNYEDIARAIRSIYKKSSGFIGLHEPLFVGNEKKYLNECIDSTFVSSVGRFVEEFEEKIAAYTGAEKAVGCVNGTNALHLALLLAGVKDNDEVICQPLSFIATCNAISYCGASPVFIDVDKDTMSLSPLALQNFLEYNCDLREDGCYNKQTTKRISACVPMHTFGHPGRIDEIACLCEKYKIPLVEDAAESLGSWYKGRHTGTFGLIGVLSFNGNKIITTGGGGMLLFNDSSLAARAKHLATQAKVIHQWEFIHDEIGFNYRMPNINAALGLGQLENIEKFVNAKRKLATQYSVFFANSNFRFFSEPIGAVSNYWLNAIITQDNEQKNELLSYLNEQKIMARPIWKLMNELKMFSNCQVGDLSNAKWFSERVINIPSSPILE